MHLFRGTSVDIYGYMEELTPYWAEPSLDGLLFYCEILINVISGISEKYMHGKKNAVIIAHQILNNITIILEKTGYEIRKQPENVWFIARKDALATQAIEDISDKDVALAVHEYNRFDLKGKLDKKKALLTVISHAVEPLRKDKAFEHLHHGLADDIGFCLNNLDIRHNNVEGTNAKQVFSKLAPAELEGLYDDLYHSMLLLIEAKAQEAVHERIRKVRDIQKEGT